MTKNTEPPHSSLHPDYLSVLVASGLVHGIQEPSRLKPVLRLFLEGDRLCSPGEPADCLWVIARGTVAVVDQGRTVVTRTIGEVVGDQALIDDVGRRRAEVLASHGPAEVLEIKKAAIEAHPQAHRIWRNFAWILCKKLDEATDIFTSERKRSASLHTLLRLYVGEHALSEGKLAPPTALEAPRSENVVIFFSDVVGFSKYSAQMSPYQAASFVQQFLTPQVEAVDRRRGYIDKFIGDAVMAYWLAVSTEAVEECTNAFLAATEARDTLSRISLGANPIRLRIGLHLGRVTIGNFGTRMRSQFTLIGPEVNKAARLESAGPENVINGGPLGTIRVSEEFYFALGADDRTSLSVPATIDAKNIGPLSIHTTAD